MSKKETIENYLEAIHILSLKNNGVRAIDVVDYLQFSRPTVSIALKQLQNNGFLHVNNNFIHLTDKGLEIATRMYERHELIAQILMKLGVEEELAYHDSCLIEHDLSVKSFEAIKKFARKHHIINEKKDD